jgi:peptidoglycan/LPS O-acetylase OafA/YrhL
MVIAGSSLIAIVLIGPVGGYETHNFWAGFPRVGFDFFGGVILYKIYLSNRLPHWRIGPIKLSIALLAIFLLPVPIEDPMLVPILFSFYFIIYSAAYIDKLQKYNSIQKLLGAISYQLYALHRPLFPVCLFLLIKLGVDMDRQYPIIVFLSSIMIFAGSYFVLKLYDEPLRAYLSRKLLKAKAT